MANNVTVDPRYLSYDKADVETLLGKVEHADSTPTENSENMIKSGAVAAALNDYATTTAMNDGLAGKLGVITTEQFEVIFD